MARLSLVLVGLLAVGCGGQTATPTPTVAPTPTPTVAPTAASVLVFPDLSEQPLSPGRYSSAPPFGLEFIFEVIGEDWVSARLHNEFFDMD